MASFLGKIFAPGSSKSIRVPAIETYDIENPVEKTARTLFHLVKLNHINHSVQIHGNESHPVTSHNFIPQVRVSLFSFIAWRYINIYMYIELGYGTNSELAFDISVPFWS
jgi:hypothetical protein